MAKKPAARSKTSTGSKAAPKLEKQTLRSLTSKARRDDKVVGGQVPYTNYTCKRG